MKGIFIGVIAGIALGAFTSLVGFNQNQKRDALFLRCFLRGGTEITDWKGYDVAYECFVDGKMVDRFEVYLRR